MPWSYAMEWSWTMYMPHGYIKKVANGKSCLLLFVIRYCLQLSAILLRKLTTMVKMLWGSDSHNTFKIIWVFLLKSYPPLPAWVCIINILKLRDEKGKLVLFQVSFHLNENFHTVYSIELFAEWNGKSQKEARKTFWFSMNTFYKVWMLWVARFIYFDFKKFYKGFNKI